MKALKLLLVLLLALSLSLSLFACNDEKPCEHTDADEDGTCDKCNELLKEEDDTPEDGVTLIKNGEFLFQIVKGNDVKVDAVKRIDAFVKMLKNDYGITVRIVGDTPSGAADCEVLIGTVTTRGEEYKYDKYSLGYEGYAIQPVGSKVIVTAGGEAALGDAFAMFVEDILGIKDDTDVSEIGTVSLSKENSVLKVQDNYRTKDVTIAGNSVRDYVIVTDYTQSGYFRDPVRSSAEALQSFFYKQVGIYIEIVNSDSFDGEENAIFVRGVAKGKAGANGFRAKLDGDDLIIECAHSNKMSEEFSTYYNKSLALSRDEVIALAKYDGDENITTVRYSDFGAKGDGITDDFEAIKEAHEFANVGGQTVYADAGKTYYINNAYSPIYIKTDVDWNNCKFIIDDSNVTVNANTNVAGITNLVRDNGMFRIEQDVPNYSIYDTDDKLIALNATKGEDGLVLRGLESGGEKTNNIGFALGYPALLTIRNYETKNYFRYGFLDAEGQDQREIVLVDKDGNIDKSTPLLHDYTHVSLISIHRADTTPITIKNATIHHIASRVNLHGGYHSINRGISIARANVTLDNLTHEISGEFKRYQPVKVDANGLSVPAEGYTCTNGSTIIGPDGKTYNGNDITVFTGHSYSGFVSVGETHNTQVKNTVFQSRVLYREGTYDIGAYLTNELVFTNCTQSNFFEEDGKTVNMFKCWGVSGTNYCKNMDYINCSLTRYDAHSGVTNGRIIGGELAVLRLIGGGEFEMDGVKIYAYSSGSPFQLREDYGASFNGTLTIRDCRVVDPYDSGAVKFTNLLSVPTAFWDMGYKTFMPNIIIDNLDIETKKGAVIYLTAKSAGTNSKYDDNHHYPNRDLVTKDPSNPESIYDFHYECTNPEPWIKANITDEGARFNGYEYEVKKHGSTSTVIVKDVPNLYPYYAPSYIKILNNSDNSYELRIWDCPFFRQVDIEGDFSWENP